MKKTKPAGMTASTFITLPDQEKERIYREIDAMTEKQVRAKSRPLSARERAEWKEIQKNLRRGRGRPQLGNGVQKVSVSVERSLLTEVDAFAKLHKLNRSELFSKSVARFIGVHETK
ncbi:MAG TPA: hypothetical protein VHY37_02365 [Tepidisphaeraceae bacterium]|jgi:hypothetical protein|nr:hypothetical protein [Tepidisphaeraceae bacterium]